MLNAANNLQVRFSHLEEVVDTNADKMDGAPVKRRMTIATIYRVSETTNADGKPVLVQLSSAVAKCHPKDNFSRPKGRYFAVQRAVAPLSKEDRTAIWNAFLQHTPPKKFKG